MLSDCFVDVLYSCYRFLTGSLYACPGNMKGTNGWPRGRWPKMVTTFLSRVATMQLGSSEKQGNEKKDWLPPEDGLKRS